MNSVNVKQINSDIFLAERIFGKNNVFWDKDLHWIMIKNYSLPKIYNQRFTNCLIIIPTGYGYGSKLEEFYLNKGIKVKQYGHYTDLPHYFEGNVHKGHSYIDKNWQWLCINPEWSKGDNLLTFLKQVELFLKFPFDETID
jgi:Prokaryotic E2 family E